MSFSDVFCHYIIEIRANSRKYPQRGIAAPPKKKKKQHRGAKKAKLRREKPLFYIDGFDKMGLMGQMGLPQVPDFIEL